jgi:excisionase family DNA binding protein
MSDPKPLSVSTGHACTLLDVGITKLKSLIRAGKLSAVKDGKRVRVITASIEKHHASLCPYVPGEALDLHPQTPVKRKPRVTSVTRRQKSANLQK